jgi:hypothetical protein
VRPGCAASSTIGDSHGVPAGPRSSASWATIEPVSRSTKGLVHTSDAGAQHLVEIVSQVVAHN